LITVEWVDGKEEEEKKNPLPEKYISLLDTYVFQSDIQILQRSEVKYEQLV